jgi:hypothetical protein
MLSTEEKAAAIVKHEETFADNLALKVLEKPKLSVWMILIPILFLYFFYQYQRFSSGRQMFRENYLKSRFHALDEAREVVESDKTPDVMALARLSGLPEEMYRCHVEVLSLLVSHYTDLMRAEGNSFNELIQSAYKNRTNYLLFVNQLNRKEKILNQVLEPHLSLTSENIRDIIKSIEAQSESLRRNSAAEFFP